MRSFIVVSALLWGIGSAAGQTGNVALGMSVRAGAVDVGGSMMHYDVRGTGEPILLIHAGVADARMWDEQVGPLSSRHTVVRCDLRGFGATARGAVRFAHHRDVATLLDSLHLEKVHVVGASFGGRVAIDFALASPRRIRSLIVCAPAISGAAPSPEILRVDSTEEAYLQRGDTVGAAAFNVRTWVVGPYREPGEVSSAIRQRVQEMQLRNYAVPSPVGAESIPLEPRAITRLEEIHVPTLVLVGDRDLPFFQNLAAIAASRIPDAKKIVIPGVAHMINMERPELFNRVLLDFVAER
jgi:3-oxoadipate enol-lactonase